MRSPARQRQILDCAKRVFATRGFHAASIADICEAAGIGRGTLYQYFRNKKSVFTAILRETLDRVRALMERQTVAGQRFPAPERLTRTQAIEFSAAQLREVLAVVFDDEDTLRIVLREAVGLDVDIETLLAEIDDVFIGIVERGLIAVRDAGITRDLDARMVATIIVGGVEKLALAALRSDAPVDLDALAREAAHLHAVGVLSDRVRPE
ncbi:MAG: TetR/AcrR family transcriptional regulator [Kofleriaceae bacterium]|nr:TetR/AcrR family transcriptional regulator [Myxococcales bacterium]MCB9559025.1 TetR/AcrR family transcriptional regulator [Kofleriaceae bacterium]MCB9574697.1 TetR/AcrR family transcriptional regulator [Kofleriaceae bacterium]